MKTARLAWLIAISIVCTAPLAADSFEQGVLAYIDGDYEGARFFWNQAAETGDPVAQFNLALLFEQGLGGDADPTTASYWYSLASQQGHPGAQFNLGGMYFAGRGVQADNERGLGWWTRAARAGFAKAQYNLGVLYMTGQHVPQNPARGIHWIERAARAGLVVAHRLLEQLPPDAAGEGTALADLNGLAWIVEQDAAAWTIHVTELASFDAALDFALHHGLEPVAAVYWTKRGTYALIGGIFGTPEEAAIAVDQLTDTLKQLQPRIVRFSAVWEDVN